MNGDYHWIPAMEDVCIWMEGLVQGALVLFTFVFHLNSVFILALAFSDGC